jgi:uncharacterized protein YjbI with pentapeptide repeats
MDPTVVAAWIAAGVSLLTLIGTLAAQYLGRRGTNKDTEKAFAEQRVHLDRTLDAQSQQLDRTLGEQRSRTLNERFATAAEQLGSDNAAVRLAGGYAMAGLADDWEENRQTCVDVLCAYLRMPYEPEPSQGALEARQLAYQAAREVRHTVIRVIAAHLRDDAAVSWQSLNFDFTGVVFDGGDFSWTRFSGGKADFSGAEFSGGLVSFGFAEFRGARVFFNGTQFSGGKVGFGNAKFSDSLVYFGGAGFSGGEVYFGSAEFSGLVYFPAAVFSGGTVFFTGAQFSGGTVDFGGAEFSGGQVNFGGACFSGGIVDFEWAWFSGAEVDFGHAEFSGGEVDFSEVMVWSFPPKFPWTDTPPLSVKLPNIGGEANSVGA